jgi:hypothetical protein
MVGGNQGDPLQQQQALIFLLQIAAVVLLSTVLRHAVPSSLSFC